MVEVVGRGSYTATAAHLGLDKSVVSRRVSALERLLRTQLVMRSTRGLRATHAGQLLADQARDIVGSGAGRERHDDPDRPLREVVRRRCRRNRKRSEQDGEQPQP